MKKYTVSLQVIKTYEIEIDAVNEEAAIEEAYYMNTRQIARKGNMTGITVDYAEVI